MSLEERCKIAILRTEYLSNKFKNKKPKKIEFKIKNYDDKKYEQYMKDILT